MVLVGLEGVIRTNAHMCRFGVIQMIEEGSTFV